MAHITLSIPDDLYEEMKKHKEIKWSEIARRGIREELDRKKGIVKGSDILKRLPEETRRQIIENKYSKSDWEKYHKKVKEKGWKRAKSSMQAR